VYRALRLQIQLHMAMTLQDEFSRSYIPGAQLIFHPTDWLGIGAWGGLALNVDSSLTDQVVTKGQTNSVNVLSLPDPKLFSQQIGRLKWIVVVPQLTFIPLRGKLGIFEKVFLDSDFYVFGGLALVGIEERADVTDLQYNACTANGTGSLAAAIPCFSGTANSNARSSRMAVTASFGAGLSLYLADFVSMSIEWRAVPFPWNTSGTDESGSARGDFPDKQINSADHLSHFNHMLTLGFGFYLPTSPKISNLDD
jgi:outer membrane beta-barrel protein